MNSLELFLAHALRLEEDSAVRYDEMADALSIHRKSEVARLFRKMAHYSRLHLAEAERRAAGLDIPRLKPWEYQWPGDDSPENAPAEDADYAMNDRDALLLALVGEKGAHAFYSSIAAATADAEIRSAAEEFAAEECGHVALLEDWLSRTPDTGPVVDLDPPAAIA